MPILIDEVVISVQVENHPASTSSAPNKQQNQAIVEACVQQVLEILKQQEEP